MMGSRSNDSGTDALSGLLALVGDPKKTAAKITEIKAQMDAMAQARKELHAGQAAVAEQRLKAIEEAKDLTRREADVADQIAAGERQRDEIAKAQADLAEREAGFVARDKERDAKARAERQAIRTEMEELKAAREQSALDLAELLVEQDLVTKARAALDADRAEVEADRQALAAKHAALAALVNGDA